MASHTQQKRGSANSKKRGHFWRKRTAPLRPERGKTPNYTICLQESDYQGRIYSQISFPNTQKLSPTILWFGAALLRLFLMFSHTLRSKNLAPFTWAPLDPNFVQFWVPDGPEHAKQWLVVLPPLSTSSRVHHVPLLCHVKDHPNQTTHSRTHEVGPHLLKMMTSLHNWLNRPSIYDLMAYAR